MCEGYDNSKFKQKIQKYLKTGSTILEIGMGPGNDYKWLSESYKVTGSDYSSEFINRAVDKFPNGNFKVLDAITIDTMNKYDSIYSCKVYQHFELSEIEKALIKQAMILTDNGIIIHSFWIGNSVFEQDDMKAIYHDKTKLLSIISNNFQILEEKVYEEFEPNDSVFIIAKKKD